MIACGLAVPTFAKNWALIIGLNEYQNVQGGIIELKYAVADARAIDARLTDLGYDTHLWENEGANRKTIVRELNRFAQLVKPEDTFLLYFAGHGVRRSSRDPQSYWLTYSAQLDTLDDEGIRLTHLLDYVRDIPAMKKIVLLDHCFSGDAVDSATSTSLVDVSGTATGGSATGGTTTGGTRGLDRIPKQLSRGVMSATDLRDQIPASAKGILVVAAARNEAIESETFKHGFFTQALLKALNTREASAGKASLTASQLVLYLKDQVAMLTNNKQQVAEFSSGTDMSSWVFVDNLPQPVANVQEAEAKRTQYFAVLNGWENQGFMQFDERLRCVDALKAWIKSLAPDGPPMTDIQKRILVEIERHMPGAAAATQDAETLATDLQQIVKSLPKT